jgi:hypothetical protein
VASTSSQLSADGRRAIADFDGDSSPDTLVVERVQSPGLLESRIAIRGSLRAELTVGGDNFPEILGVGDLNHDGLQDALLADVDESSVWSGVLLVSRSALRFAPLESSTPAGTMSYLWDTTEDHHRCLASVLPRIERGDAGSPVISVAVGQARAVADCMNPNRLRLRLVEDTLRVVN